MTNCAVLGECVLFCLYPLTGVGSRGAVVSAALSERKVAGSIPTIGDFHTVGPCKKAVFACLATDVKIRYHTYLLRSWSMRTSG